MSTCKICSKAFKEDSNSTSSICPECQMGQSSMKQQAEEDFLKGYQNESQKFIGDFQGIDNSDQKQSMVKFILVLAIVFVTIVLVVFFGGKALLQLAESNAPVPTPSPLPNESEAPVSFHHRFYIAHDNTPIYKKASEDSKVLIKAPKHFLVYASNYKKKIQKEQWVYVKISDQQSGWVKPEQLSEKMVGIPDPEKTPEPTPTPSAKSIELPWYTTLDGVNLRSEATTSAKVVKELDINTEVELTEETKKDSVYTWLKVKVKEGPEGWLVKRFISQNKIEFTTKTEVLNDSVNIRATPSIKGSLVSNVKKGTVLMASDEKASKDGYSWVMVLLPDKRTRGWIAEEFIITTQVERKTISKDTNIRAKWTLKMDEKEVIVQVRQYRETLAGYMIDENGNEKPFKKGLVKATKKPDFWTFKFLLNQQEWSGTIDNKKSRVIKGLITSIKDKKKISDFTGSIEVLE